MGKTLVRRFVNDNEVLVFSRDEAKQWTLRNEFKHPNLSFEVGDMRDKQRVDEAINTWEPDYVIIAAALKQVDTCELAPLESIKTNILGVENVVSSVAHYTQSRQRKNTTVCMVSTDKACSPTNVYGMCKSIAERVVLEYARRDRYGNKYVAVRYGNVLESRGSIIPLFKYQAEHNDAFTLTHPDMTRFIMTLDQSVDLIVNTMLHAKTGETWIPKLPSMKIKDLAAIFSDMHDKPVEVIGMRPGEKIHESLISDTESFRARLVTTQGERVPYMEIERGNATADYYALASAFDDLPGGGTGSIWPSSTRELGEYTSFDDRLDQEELFDYLKSLGVLDMPIEEHEGKSIEDIRT